MSAAGSAPRRSGNEISALVLKAARGAGMPLGCAEEVSGAAVHLAQMGQMAAVLVELNGPFEPVSFAGGILHGGHGTLAAIAWLDLLEAGQSVAPPAHVPVVMVLGLKLGREISPPVGPFDVPADIWDRLSDFAARTFVPESAASRSSGAGAGLLDND